MKVLSGCAFFLLILTASCSLQSVAENKQIDNNFEKLLSDLSGEDTFSADNAAFEISKYGDQAIAPLTSLLASGKRDACAGALRAFALIGNPGAAPAVITFLTNLSPVPQNTDTFADEYLRHEAIRCLGYLKDPKAIPLLEQALSQGDKHTQIQALVSLIKLGQGSVRDTLISYLNSSDPSLRTLAIKGIGEINDQNLVPKLLPLIADDQWYVRDTLAETLGKLGGAEALTTLQKLSKDANPFVRKTALTWLSTATRKISD